MITGRICRIFVSRPNGTVPKGYTFKRHLKDLRGLKSNNIHIHLGAEWEIENNVDDLNAVIINLSANPRPPLITFGEFDPRISKMLVAMEILEP
jgi:hypothetical protein